MAIAASSQPRSGRMLAALLNLLKQEACLPDRDRTEWKRVASPEEAVAELERMHGAAVDALRSALKRFFADRRAPDAATRRKFRYPELRITYSASEAHASTRRAFA